MITIKKYGLFSLIIILLLLSACSSSVGPSPDNPEGDFWADPPIFQACLSGKVRFTLTNDADLSGAEYEYEYDFGDSTGILRVGGNNVVHLYSKEGTYDAKLKIFQNNELKLEKFQQIVVKDDAGCGSIGGIDSDNDEYIVVLKDNVGSVDSVLNEVIDIGGEKIYDYQNALKGFAVSLSSQEATQMGGLAEVDFVELDRIIELPPIVNADLVELDRIIEFASTQSPVPSWGLDRIDQRDGPVNNSYSYQATGKGIHTYIIDSGIRASHQDFADRVTGGISFISDGRGTGDCNGHGTHVAGTVGGSSYGVAKEAKMHPVRVFSCEGVTQTSVVIEAIDWVTQNHQKPAVANLSLGGNVSNSLDLAVSNSISKGVTYVLAAGNENANSCLKSPARVPEAVTVGSSTLSDQISDFSNQGSCIDLFAPGSKITSTWKDSDTANLTISGTSMAAPHVAGAAALYLEENPNATPAQVQSALLGKASRDKLSRVNSNTSNLLLYVEPDESSGVKVELDRTNVTLQPNQRIEFSAKVTGTTNTDVIWELGEGNGGVDGTGNKVLYTAPESSGEFFLKATSVVDKDASVIAVIKIVTGVSVTITPASIELKPNEQVTFTALVEGSQNTDVTWKVSDGEFDITDNTITYTAPNNLGEHTVEATSVADPNAKALAKIIVKEKAGTCNEGVEISISPERVKLKRGEKQAFIAIVACTNNTGVNWELTPVSTNSITSQIVPKQNSSSHTFIFGLCVGSQDWTLTAVSAADDTKTATANIICDN